MKLKEPSEELRVGRREIETISQYELLDDLVWIENEKCWVMKYRLTIDLQENDYVPSITDWYMTIEDQYPFGDINIYPALENGLACTFQHQSSNYAESQNPNWTNGKLCVVPQNKILGEISEGESYSSKLRLRWYIKRNIDWLIAASKNELQKQGDFFELPDFPTASNYRFAYDEDQMSFNSWAGFDCKHGLADLVLLNKNLILKRYFADKGIQKSENFSGKYINDIEEINGTLRAIWVYLEKTPIVLPWQAPIIWKELKEILSDNGIDFYELIGPLLHNVRDRNLKVLLLAFPISEKVGEPAVSIHWQAIELPEISSIKNPPKGFRNNKNSLLLYDKMMSFQDYEQIKWMKSDNWSRSQISTRGQLLKKFNTKNVLLIGVGALGSILAEILVRSGIEKLTIFDDDPTVNCGNLVRHILTQDDIGKSKVIQTAIRLNKIFPNVNVNPRHEDITSLNKGCFNEFDVIIDCTANQEVLQFLNSLNLEENKLFVSISFGDYLKRIYYFTCNLNKFDYGKFAQLLNTEIAKENKPNKDSILIREGLGCWHPAYPGTIDDIHLFVGAIMKDLVVHINTPPDEPFLITYNSKYESDEFVGIEKTKTN